MLAVWRSTVTALVFVLCCGGFAAWAQDAGSAGQSTEAGKGEPHTGVQKQKSVATQGSDGARGEPSTRRQGTQGTAPGQQRSVPSPSSPSDEERLKAALHSLKIAQGELTQMSTKNGAHIKKARQAVRTAINQAQLALSRGGKNDK